MKKQIVLFSLTFVILIVVLSGCTEQNTPGSLDNRFFGNWVNQVGLNVTFASNGSCYSEVMGWACHWEVKNGRLHYYYDNGDESYQDFTFSNDNMTLTVTMAGGNIVYTKIA